MNETPSFGSFYKMNTKGVNNMQIASEIEEIELLGTKKNAGKLIDFISRIYFIVLHSIISFIR